MLGNPVAKPTIDEKQEAGRRRVSCYSQVHWRSRDLLADRATVRTDTRKPEN